MRKTLFFISLAAFTISFIGKKKKAFIPPGTVKICDTLYADQEEITNLAWLDYEIWIKAKYGANSPEHQAVLPDTTVWRHKNATNEPYVQYYYRHPAYHYYPVVGVSYEQALAYCKWRTEQVKRLMAISKKYPRVDFEYRLPTKSEWEFISNDGIGYFSNGGKNDKNKITSNHRWARDNEEAKQGYQHNFPEVTAPAKSYEKNAFGLYNMIGNVAEMISEKGISKGGSWRNLLEECRVGKDIPYEKPTAWLGFRCICIVKANSSS